MTAAQQRGEQLARARRRRQQRHGPFAPVVRAFRRYTGDLLAFCALASLLCAWIVYAAVQPPTRFAFAVDDRPAAVQFRGFFGLESNAAGPYRWSKPEAAIILPVNAPGRYRVTLTLQDGAPGPESRPTTIYGSGVALATVELDKSPRDYGVDYELGTRAWVGRAQQALQVELQGPEYLPEDDARALGVVVRRVAVERLSPTTPNWPALLLPALAALSVVYVALRALDLRPFVAAAPILGAAALVAIGPSPGAATLVATYQPLAHPFRFGLLLSAFVALPALARAVGVVAPGSPGSTALQVADRPRPGIGHVARATEWRQWIGRLAVVPILVLAAGLRLYRYDRLSLWLDEGATAHFARLPWPGVLGFEGWYDLHPPLYYSSVKLVTLLVPAATAGRLVSIATGTLTVLVLYALAERVLNRRAAIVSGLVLAVSPLHVWYSQEARMYTPSVLFVGLSYLALVAFWQGVAGVRPAGDALAPAEPAITTRGGSRWRWATVYGVAIALAMYTVYSSFYALLPQVGLLAFIVWRHRGRALPILLGLVGASLAYLPWVPQVLSTVRASNEIASRDGYLSATIPRIKDSLLSLSGLGGGLGVYSEWRLTPWARSGPWQPLLLALVLVALVVGAIGVARRRPIAPIVAGALSAGTIGTAILISQLSPGYADRTILYATLGWALLVGGAAWTFERRRLWQRGLGLLCILLILATSASSLDGLYRGGKKQDYRRLVRETSLAVSLTDRPVVPLGSWMMDFLDAYTPGQEMHVARLTPDGRIVDDGGLDLETDAVWLAYSDFAWDNISAARKQLATLGYERLMHKYFRDPLYLDLYARPGANLAAPGGVPGRAVITMPAPLTDWQLPPVGGSVGGSQITLRGQQRGVVAATAVVPVAHDTLVGLELDARTAAGSAIPSVALTCINAAGTASYTSTVGTDPSSVGKSGSATGRWRALRVAALCPAGTTATRATLRVEGVGEAQFRDIRAWQATQKD